MRIISPATAAAPRCISFFSFVAPKKIKEENVKWQQTKWRHGRHSALPCAKKQAAKDEDRVKEEVDAA